jgi:2-octaprenyl-6-methoxyphenol hydroxylase
MQADSSSATILIIGGGMVGVTLALLLAEDPGLRITLVEAAPLPVLVPGEPLPYRPSFDARNTALSRRTVATYRALGLWDELQAHATPIHSIHISDRGRFGMARLNAAEERVESFGQVIENAWLGLVLLGALRQRANVQIIDGATVTGIHQARDVITADIRQGETRFSLSAPLLVAADGADSACRGFLGLSAEKQDYGQTAIVTTVATHLPHQHMAFERFTDAGPIALLPLPDERRALVWTLPSGAEEKILALDDNGFLTALQAAFGRRAGKFTRVGKRFAYPLGLMVAHHQVQPRAVILGNAAHTLHPVAGQGFNLCLRDCLALSERVMRAARQGGDIGDFALLRDYEAARATDQNNVIQFSDKLVRGFSSTLPGWTLLRNIGLVGFDLLPQAKQTLARYAMGLNS